MTADTDFLGVDFEMTGWRSPKSGRFIAVSGRAKDRMQTAANKTLQASKRIAEELSPVGKLRKVNPRAGKREERNSIKKSWDVRFTPNAEGATATLLNKAKHFRFYVEGTIPHPIDARRATLLVFPNKAGDGWTFIKHVEHPGTKPHDLLEKLSAKVNAEASAEVRRVANQVTVDIRKALD